MKRLVVALPLAALACTAQPPPKQVVEPLPTVAEVAPPVTLHPLSASSVPSSRTDATAAAGSDE
jgi:hypothetical protein